MKYYFILIGFVFCFWMGTTQNNHYKIGYTDGYQAAYSQGIKELTHHCSDLANIEARNLLYEKSIAECKSKP